MAGFGEWFKRILRQIEILLFGRTTMDDKAKWTLMVYLAGDNNLSAAGEKDLSEMRAVGSTEEVNIVVEFDRVGNARETQRYHIERDGVDERVESLGETDCGDPNVLVDFIRWSALEYPAHRYGLVLWNHGGGWEPSEIDRIARHARTPNYYGREAPERSASTMGRAFFRTTWERIMSLQSVDDRAICCDDGSGHSLDTVELGNVLAQATEALGQPLDLLGMDACLMSNLEVAYQARPYVHYIVASEESEPNDGWPYEAVLRFLVDHPDAETSAVAGHIVQAYVQDYVDRGHDGPVTQAALDLAQVDTLTDKLDALCDALAPRMATAKFELGEALYRTPANFWHGTLWDVANVCRNLYAQTADQATKDAAQGVWQALQPDSSVFITAEAHNGEKVQACGGTTIYLPPRILHQVSRYYAELDFARDHKWAGMLGQYHGA